MKPTNVKTLFHFLLEQMDKLDKGEVTPEQANAQAGLAKQSFNLLKYEIDKAKVQLELLKQTQDIQSNIRIGMFEGEEEI